MISRLNNSNAITTKIHKLKLEICMTLKFKLAAILFPLMPLIFSACTSLPPCDRNHQNHDLYIFERGHGREP